MMESKTRCPTFDAYATNAVFYTIENTLATKEKVQITGFGAFEVCERAERTGRNPHTGGTITVPAGTTPAFKPGQLLKDAIAVYKN